MEKAQSEPAWESAKEIKQESLLIWRIEGALVKQVDPADHGIFFSDAVYIILKSSNKHRKICHDLHFWLPYEQDKVKSINFTRALFEVI